MSTIDKKTADDVMAGKYEEDMPVKIVKYTNMWGGESYGVVRIMDRPDRYKASPSVIMPETIWEHPRNKCLKA